MDRKKTVWRVLFVGGLWAALIGGSCDGDRGPAGSAGPEGPQGTSPAAVTKYDDLPGVVLEITGLSSASAATFQAGDKISVNFTLEQGDGSALSLSEMSSAAIWMSGPTSNYQHIIPDDTYSLGDVKTVAVANADGSYTYTFATAIPATYPAPLNDTTRFTDGELTGQSLLAGTYTVAMRMYKYFYIDGVRHRDVANATKDFLFGGAATLEPREVVKVENCNQCHVTVQMHGGSYRDPKLCITCHTAGAEDGGSVNDATDQTPQTIEFRVMIHKLHNGAHLPSVLGVATNADGSRNYSATPASYKIGSYSVLDFSGIHFPVWPNMSYAMPRDAGYTALTSAEKALEDEIRKGVTACDKCHGDPDGSGPLASPAQGNLAYVQPSRRACGACHDDVNFSLPYTANGQTMPAQADDANCTTCHVESGTAIAVRDGHVHPSNDSALNPGMNVTLNSITPSAGGTLDPGEKLALDISITDDSGANVDPSTLYRMTVVITGPNNNRQMLQRQYFPLAALGTTASNYTISVPQFWPLAYLGDATGAAETLAAARTPFWADADSSVEVYERTATGAGNTLAADAIEGTNYIEVTTGGTFAADDYVVLDDGGPNEEYYKIYAVTGNTLSLGRISTSSMEFQPHLRMAHVTGTTINVVTLTLKALSTDYTLTEASGQVHLVAGQFGAGNAVLVSSRTDWVMPNVYTHGYNRDTIDDETWGEWGGKTIQDGTYHVGIYPRKRFYVVPPRTLGNSGDTDATQYYSSAVTAANGDFLVGAASGLAPYDLISSPTNCDACHDQVWQHGRKGAETCLTCHGTAGFGSTGVDTANFRVLLHRIHRGSDLANAATYKSGDFANIVFPAMPGKVKHCDKCHGTSDAWKQPADRDHLTEQNLPTRTWRATCGACHDSNATGAHIDLQTSLAGVESCAVCHGSGKEFSVEVMHKTR